MLPKQNSAYLISVLLSMGGNSMVQTVVHKLSYSLFLIFAFIGCSTTHIDFDTQKNNVSIVLDGKNLLQMRGTALWKNQINLSHIKIYQYKYKFYSNIIAYEEAIAQDGYFFQHPLNKTVSIVFPKFSYKVLYRIGNFTFYELLSKESKKQSFYLLVENINKKRLQFLYGIDKNSFYSLMDACKEHKKFTLHKSTFLKSETQIISQWNYKNIILDTLVGKHRIKSIL